MESTPTTLVIAPDGAVQAVPGYTVTRELDQAVRDALAGEEDLTSRHALSFGVTASLGADQDYERSQAFAAHAVEEGFGGVRYLVRHDAAQKLFGIALFGGAGADESDAWPSGDEEPLSLELVSEAHRRFGYRVLPTP